jgi:hypothetical protein
MAVTERASCATVEARVLTSSALLDGEPETTWVAVEVDGAC